MKFLLDSHVLLWILADDSRLSARARSIALGGNPFSVSIVSLWELTIKMSLGRLTIADSSVAEIHRKLVHRNVQIIPVTMEQLVVLASLPHHHGDPFDRLLIAQAISHGLPVVTADAQFSRYPVEVVW